MRFVAALALSLAAAGCGQVVVPPPDAGVDAGATPPDCTEYCSVANFCTDTYDFGDEPTCCNACRCTADQNFRIEVAQAYVLCVGETRACSPTMDTDCLESSTDGVSPTSDGANYALVCDTRRKSDCLALDCQGDALRLKDEVIEEIAVRSCLSQSTCDEVLACIAQVQTDRCGKPNGTCAPP